MRKGIAVHSFFTDAEAVANADIQSIRKCFEVKGHRCAQGHKNYLSSLNHWSTIQSGTSGITHKITFCNSPSTEGLFVVPQNLQLFIYF